MRFLSYFLRVGGILPLFAGMLSSCTDDSSAFDVEDPQSTMKLIISTTSANSKSVTSRADGHFDYDDPFAEGNPASEEAINRVEMYFFKNNKDTGAAFHHTTFTDVDKHTVAEFSMKIPIDMAENFQASENGSSKTAYVYVLVNLPDGTSLPADDAATLDALGDVHVQNPGFISAGAPAEFVMRGGNTVTLGEDDSGDVSIKGWIPVERLASKVRMFCNIHPYVYLDADGKSLYKFDKESEEAYQERLRRDTQEIWKAVPYTGGLNGGAPNTFLYFYNFTNSSLINGGAGKSTGETIDRKYDNIDRSADRVDLARVITTGIELADYTDNPAAPLIKRDEYPYSHSAAFYSYPNEWKSTDIDEQHATNVTMRLQWQCVFDRGNGDEVFDENNPGDGYRLEYFYYQIPVNRLAKTEGDYDRMSPNTYYRIKIDIAMLGARELGTPIEVEASWEALPWSSTGVEVSIKDRRYLVVNQTQWTMNNISRLVIPFSSSHDVEITDCYVNYFRYNDVWGTDNDTDDSRNEEAVHDSKEFNGWLTAATRANVKETEGEITQSGLEWGTTGQPLAQRLYYKKEYFYDEIYAGWDRTDDGGNHGPGYKYYIGHEHPKTFQEEYITKPATLTAGWKEYITRYELDSVYHCYIDQKRHEIVFNHPLVWWKEAYVNGQFYYEPEMKNGRLRDEYSRCEIIIKIRHIDRPEDEHLFEETIYITQYPGMYVEVSHDYGSPVPESGSTASGNRYVLVNGHATQSERYATSGKRFLTDWYQVSSYMHYFGYINNNPNMYVIHTSQLSEENVGNYIIGDPRSLYYNNQLGSNSRGVNERLHDTDNVPNNNNAWTGYDENLLSRTENMANAPRLYYGDTNGNGYMKYYYPSDETVDVGTKENFIAPSFRVASSFGKVSLHYSWAQGALRSKYLDIESWKEARRRCAVYQEAGRPAGRWRIPTMAEIDYVMQLSIDGKIPHLFGLPLRQGRGKEELYYSSTGLVGVNVTDNVITKYDIDTYEIDQSPAVRCVYDDWYWIKADGTQDLAPDAPITTTFYWGDKPKDNPQN